MQAIEFEAVIKTTCWPWKHEAEYSYLAHPSKWHPLQ